MAKTITAKSGIKGWQDKLQRIYESFDEFVAFCDMYNIHARLGFNSPEEAWEDNPTIQGSTNPSDLRVV